MGVIRPTTTSPDPHPPRQGRALVHRHAHPPEPRAGHGSRAARSPADTVRLLPRPTGCRRAWPSWTHRTSIRSSPPTVASPGSCSPPPISGSSSRPRRDMPMPSLDSLRQARTGGWRSPSSWTECRRRSWRGSGRISSRCCASRVRHRPGLPGAGDDPGRRRAHPGQRHLRLRTWLERPRPDAAARETVVRQTLSGALARWTNARRNSSWPAARNSGSSANSNRSWAWPTWRPAGIEQGMSDGRPCAGEVLAGGRTTSGPATSSAGSRPGLAAA